MTIHEENKLKDVVLSFKILAWGLGAIILINNAFWYRTWKDNRLDAIRVGAAEYNATTGRFQWKTNVVVVEKP